MRGLIVAAVLLATSQAVAAETPGDWQRASSPDGAVSAMTPCKKAELVTDVADSGFHMVCAKNGVMLVATSGMPAPDGKIISFDEQLAAAKQSLSPGEIDEAPMFGHRAFKIICAGRSGVPCIELIDWRPNRPLLVAAVEAGGPGTATPDQLPAIVGQSRSFYASLEVGK